MDVTRTGVGSSACARNWNRSALNTLHYLCGNLTQGKLMAWNLGEYGAIFADDQLLISFETSRW